MNLVTTYFDYRQFLRDWFEDQKKNNAFMSYRYVAAKSGMDPSHVVKIFHGQLHLVDAKIDTFVKLCDFSEEEESYFRLLILYNKARNAKEKQIYLDKLLKAAETPGAQITRDQYMFFTKWHYTAVWCALDIFILKDNYKELAHFLKPSISEKEVQESLELLQRLGLVSRNSEGIWKSTEQNITTGKQWRSAAIREYQRELMRLSVESLDTFPKEARDVSTLTLVADQVALEECRIVTEEYRKTLQRISNQCANPDRVLQINIQAFPLTSTRTVQP